MPAGRPRTVSYTPEKMVELGEEMINWVLENKPMHLSQWYHGAKRFVFKDWETMRKAPEFFMYYEQALSLVGLQYIEKNSNIEPNVKNRWLRVYFKDLRKREDEDLDAASDRAQKVAQSAYTLEQLAQFDTFLLQMKSYTEKPKKN